MVLVVIESSVILVFIWQHLALLVRCELEQQERAKMASRSGGWRECPKTSMMKAFVNLLFLVG